MRPLAITLGVLALAALIGVPAYMAGLAQGAAGAAPAAVPGAAPAMYPYAYGWHFGFGFFGLLVPILFFFLMFGLIRALFGWGRWGGHRGWYDRGSDDVPSRVEEWHRRLHERKPSDHTPPQV